MTETGKPYRSGGEVLRFLDNHRLEHTPDHYAFGFAYLSGEDAVLKAKVDSIVDGGIRITAEQVRKLAPTRADNKVPLGSIVPQLDAVTLRVLDIIADTLDATGGLNRDLVRASSMILHDTAPNIRAIVAGMIERTASTEKSLTTAVQQAQSLRAELTALRDEHNRDGLTGLLDRVAIADQVVAALKALCCVAVIDVDNLKRVNDTYGQAVGDRVLKAIAAAIEEACAPHPVGRWEDEKFVVLLEAVELQAAIAVLEHARKTVAGKSFRLRESDQELGSITVSAGVAAGRGRAMEDVLDAAEVLLRDAKGQGRNLVLGETRLVDVGQKG